jgi:hypothetical protein
MKKKKLFYPLIPQIIIPPEQILPRIVNQPKKITYFDEKVALVEFENENDKKSWYDNVKLQKSFTKFVFERVDDKPQALILRLKLEYSNKGLKIQDIIKIALDIK